MTMKNIIIAFRVLLIHILVSACSTKSNADIETNKSHQLNTTEKQSIEGTRNYHYEYDSDSEEGNCCSSEECCCEDEYLEYKSENL